MWDSLIHLYSPTFCNHHQVEWSFKILNHIIWILLWRPSNGFPCHSKWYSKSYALNLLTFDIVSYFFLTFIVHFRITHLLLFLKDSDISTSKFLHMLLYLSVTFCHLPIYFLLDHSSKISGPHHTLSSFPFVFFIMALGIYHHNICVCLYIFIFSHYNKTLKDQRHFSCAHYSIFATSKSTWHAVRVHWMFVN